VWAFCFFKVVTSRNIFKVYFLYIFMTQEEIRSGEDETIMELYVGKRTPFRMFSRFPVPLKEIIEKNYYDDMIGSPGVITENPAGGHNIYGLHNCLDRLPGSFEYGELEGPERLLHFLNRSRSNERVVNGCLILVPGKGNKIIVSPDYDLIDTHGETFDEDLTGSLERTVRNYINKEGFDSQMDPHITSEIPTLDGSPISMGYWNPPRFDFS
jgi:hypothetical protein